MVEDIIALWMNQGIIELKYNYTKLQNLMRHLLDEIYETQTTNLWDLYRSNYLRDDVLPYIRRQIGRSRKELHCLLCTSKTAYINGYPTIENNISRIW